MRKGTFSFTVVLILVAGIIAQAQHKNPDEYYNTLAANSFNNIYFQNIDSMRMMYLAGKELMGKYPQHEKVFFILRVLPYFAIRVEKDLSSFANTHIAEVNRVVMETPKENRGFDYYYYISGAYNSLFYILRKTGEFKTARSVLLDAENLCKAGLSKFNSNTHDVTYFNLLSRLSLVYNNLSLLLYITTHHLDSKGRKNEVGKILEYYYNKQDSIFSVEDRLNSTEIDIFHRYIVKSNALLSFKGYYKLPLKIDSINSEIKKYGNQLCSDDPAGEECKRARFLIKATNGWVDFSNRDFVATIKSYRGLLPEFDSLVSRFPSIKDNNGQLRFDILYALSESYYNLHKNDSALYYGNLMLQDSLLSMDYAALASTTAILSELYMDTNLAKSKQMLALSRMYLAKSESEIVRALFVSDGKALQLKKTENKFIEISQRYYEIEQQALWFRRIVYILVISGMLVALFILLKQLNLFDRLKSNF